MLHHVHNRGARKRAIFFDDRDRRSFLWLLGDAVGKYGGVVHAFCLMGNHFHLLVGTTSGTLDRLMQSATSRYVKRFNWRHGLDGPMFKDRYTNHPITEPGYLWAAARYIHANPIDVPGADVVTYPWSSLRAYANPRLAASWLTTDLVLSSAGGDSELLVSQVLAYIDQPATATPPPGGSSGQTEPGAILDDVLTTTERLMFCGRDDLLRTGNRRTNVARLLACHIAVREAGLPPVLVSQVMRFATQSGLRKALKRFDQLADQDPVLAAMSKQSWRIMPSRNAA